MRDGSGLGASACWGAGNAVPGFWGAGGRRWADGDGVAGAGAGAPGVADGSGAGTEAEVGGGFARVARGAGAGVGRGPACGVAVVVWRRDRCAQWQQRRVGKFLRCSMASSSEPPGRPAATCARSEGRRSGQLHRPAVTVSGRS